MVICFEECFNGFADEKAETSQQEVFDYVSGDELPTKVLSESDEKKKSKRMEEL